MLLIHPKRAYCHAFIATVCSVLGGIAGWFIAFIESSVFPIPIDVLYIPMLL